MARTLSEPISTLSLLGVKLDSDEFIFARYDTDADNAPHYSVGEVAKFFFGFTSHWLRWREMKGDLVLGGKEVEVSRTETGIRTYTLADVEKITHALMEQGFITTNQMAHALVLCKVEAMLYGVIPPDEAEIEVERLARRVVYLFDHKSIGPRWENRFSRAMAHLRASLSPWPEHKEH
jgi:hypothetical protein